MCSNNHISNNIFPSTSGETSGPGPKPLGVGHFHSSMYKHRRTFVNVKEAHCSSSLSIFPICKTLAPPNVCSAAYIAYSGVSSEVLGTKPGGENLVCKVEHLFEVYEQLLFFSERCSFIALR